MNLNTEHRRMEDKSVTAFLLSPHYRTCRHLLLQIIVLLMTINVFWYEPLQSVSFWRRFGGFLAYFVSINTVIYMNLYILVPCFLLKNRLGHYVLAAVLTNLVVIVFLSVTQGLLFEVILPGKNPGRFATFINTFSGILTIGFVTAGSAAISLFTHWLRYNLRIDELESTTLQSELTFLKNLIIPNFLFIMLNNANAMEIDEIKNNDGVDAIMEIGFPGGYGFYGVADILSGEANPSGHLTDTYAVTNANSPAAQNFGNYEWTNADPSVNINAEEVEAEDIYTGYKYYETRYADTVLGQGNADATVGSSTGKAWNYDDEVSYPFGYGLSYTTFEQTLKSVDVDLANRTVTAEVDVKNTGDVAGKDVVQLYTSVPYTDYDVENKVEKSAVQLLDYEKTDMIEPGESQTVTITADAQDMASWDSSCENEAGTTGNWILDNGTYYFTVGNGAHEAVNNVLAAQNQDVEGNKDNVQTWELGDFDSSSFAVTLNGTPVENQLQDADLNNWMEDTVTYLSRNDWEGTWPETYKDLTATDEMISTMADDYSDIEANGDPSSVTFGADNGMSLANMKGVEDITDERWSTLMDQLTLEECLIRTGLGGTSTKVIESITSPEAIQNDGPNGFNSYPLGQYANSDASSGDPCVIAEDDPNRDYKMGVMANETVIGQTFSKQLAAEWGKAVGNYSLWANTAI